MKEVALLWLFFSLHFLFTLSFNCTVCQYNSNIYNSDSTWNIPPTLWDNLPPSSFDSAYAMLTPTDDEIKAENYTIVVSGGRSEFNDKGDLVNKLYTNQLVFSENKNATPTYQSYDLPYGVEGHTMTSFPECYNCSSSPYNGQRGIFFFGNSSSPMIFTQQNGTYLLSVTGGPSNRKYHSAVHTFYYARERGIGTGKVRRYNTAGSVLIFSGVSSSLVNDVWAFHLDNQTWERIHDGSGNAPSGRYHHSAVMWKNKMIVYGGLNTSPVCFDELWIFNLETSSWTRPSVSGNVPNRYDHGAVVTSKGEMIILNGINCVDSKFNLWQFTEVFDIENYKWSSYPLYCLADNDYGNYFPPRYSFGTFLLRDDAILIYGGISLSLSTPNYIKLSSPRLLNIYRDTKYRADYEIACLTPNDIAYVDESEAISISCNTTHPYPCWVNNATTVCLKTFNDCANITNPNCHGNSPYKCWNGLCVSHPRYCTAIPSCPAGQQRCSDGSCSQQCNSIVQETCGVFCNPSDQVNVCKQSCCDLNCPTVQNCTPGPCVNVSVGSPLWIQACCLQCDDCCCSFGQTCCSNTNPICTPETNNVAKSNCLIGCQDSPSIPCPLFSGCKVGYYQCPRGDCVDDVAKCHGTCNIGEYQCSDNTCVLSVDECAKPLFKKNVKPFYLPIESDKVDLNIMSINNEILSFVQISKIPADNTNTKFVIVLPADEGVIKDKNISITNARLPGLPGEDAFPFKILSPVIKLSLNGFIIGEVKIFLKIEDLPDNETLNNGCLAYLVPKKNEWACHTSVFTSITKFSNTLYGIETQPINLEGYGFYNVDHPMGFTGYLKEGIFAIIRKTWRRPNANEIIRDINITYNETTFSSVVEKVVQSFEVFVQNATLKFSIYFDNINQQGNLTSTIKRNLNARYQIPNNNIQIIYTLSNQKRNFQQNNATLYSAEVKLSDVVFPPIQTPTSPQVVVPQPNEPQPVTNIPVPSGNGTVSPIKPPDEETGFIGIVVGATIGSVIAAILLTVIIYCFVRSSHDSSGNAKNKSATLRSNHSNYTRNVGRTNPTRNYESRGSNIELQTRNTHTEQPKEDIQPNPGFLNEQKISSSGEKDSKSEKSQEKQEGWILKLDMIDNKESEFED